MFEKIVAAVIGALVGAAAGGGTILLINQGAEISANDAWPLAGAGLLVTLLVGYGAFWLVDRILVRPFE